MPVHMWLVRHVYFPCMHYSRSKQFSVVVVFALSALFHELAVGVPMNLIRGWAFWGIMGQIPLIHLTASLNKLLKNDQAGNIFFWCVDERL
jgi:diacylglycerol O-acyltransferase-1